ncbi:sigma-54-dependent transcriptional regulator [Pseudomonadota bacterium]
MKRNVLLVDDDSIHVNLCSNFIEKMDFNPVVAYSGKSASEFLFEKKDIKGITRNEIDVILLDLDMPEINGLDILKKLRYNDINIPVIILTSKTENKYIEEAVKEGATDYIVKGSNETFMRVLVSINNALAKKNLKQEVSKLRGFKGEDRNVFTDILGTNEKIQEIVKTLQKTVDSSIPIFITGENGTGKELFARAIHGSSKRAEKPFVAVNCGAIPENLVESTLFGHEKGSFTGAISSHLGKFREADGGTLFLDEVGELTPDIQVKLLRVLQEGEVEPVGGKSSVKVDIRIISATNKNVEQEVKSKKFREDLYYRLNIFPVKLPALRERKEDITTIANHFCYIFSAQEDKNIIGITEEGMDLLMKYDWPGNVRQLKNTIFRAVILADGNRLDIIDFPNLIDSMEDYEPESKISTKTSKQSRRFDTTQSLTVSLLNEINQIKNLEEIETEIIEKTIRLCKGNISKVAKSLNIGRSTIYRKVKLGEE